MAVYKNSNTASNIAAVEFTPVSDGNFSFFYVDSPAHKDAVKQWLTSEKVGQEIITETMLKGKPVIVTHGDRSQDDVLKLMEENGDKLKLSHHPKPMNPWAWRGGLSIIGHSMNLYASTKRVGGKFDFATGLFAICNLAANLINITYGAQKEEDINRLRFLKEEMNGQLTTEAWNGAKLPDTDERRSKLRMEPPEPKSVGQKVNGFLERNSVLFGETFLRYLGGVFNVLPLNRFKSGWAELKQGNIKEAWEKSKNPAFARRWSAIMSLTGKNMAFMAKGEDPYDPKPKSAWDNFREKYMFRLSTAVDGSSFAWQSFDSFTNPNQKIVLRGKQYRDFIGGIGSGLFAVAYIARFFAPFEVKKVNMEELNAHVTDSLAKLPPEKLPQFMADTAAYTVEHFSEKNDVPLDFGKTFTTLMTDMYRYHHISLDNLGTEPEERRVKAQKTFQSVDPAPDKAPTTRRTLQKTPRKPLDMVTAPASSNVEKVAESPAANMSIAP